MFNAVTSEPAGEWYLGVYCRKCQAPIPVFRDPGGGTAITAGSGKLTVACPRCGKKAHYAAREVITFLVYADRAAPADRAPVNDDQPIDRDTPLSGSKMSEPEPVLDLAPYEIPESEPEPVLELDATAGADDQDPTPEAEAADLPADEAPLDAAEAILELGPYEAPDLEPEATPELAADAEAEASAPEPELEPEVEIPASAAAPSQSDALPPAEPELHPVVDIAPALELTPAEAAPDAPFEIAQPTADDPHIGDDQPVDLSMPAPETETAPALVLHESPEPVAAPEPEQTPDVDVEPAPRTDPDPARELEAFFDASPIVTDEIAAGDDQQTGRSMPVAASESAAAPESEQAPDVDIEPAPQIEHDAALELEAFFDASPIAEPAQTVEAKADVPELTEPAAAEVMEPAAPGPPAPPAPPAAPKPIAVVYRERWADPADRPRIIKELRPLIHGLKARAEAQRHDVLVRVTDLFTDYLVEVAPERQSGVAIEQYIHAVFALSERGRIRGTDRVGEEMAATLRALNRHAGLYTSR